MKRNVLVAVAWPYASSNVHLPAGQAMQPPRPLLKKLDESIVEQELARMG